MARAHETDYTKKHDRETKTNPAVDAEIRALAKNHELPCAVAFEIASNLDIPVKEVGISLDFLHVRLTKCQLGLFGHQPVKKIASPAALVDPALAEAIAAHSSEGRLPCASAWKIASSLDLGKMAVSSACETLKIKIKPCQLGAF